MQIQELRTERDEAWVEATESGAFGTLLSGKVMEIMTEMIAHKAHKNTLTTQVGMLRGGRSGDRAEIQTVTMERDVAQMEVWQLGDRVEAFEVTGWVVHATITEIRGMDRRRLRWYRKRRYVGGRARCVIRCATWLMIRDAWNRADQMIARLTLHMGHIGADRIVEAKS